MFEGGRWNIRLIEVNYKGRTLYAKVSDEDYDLVSQYRWNYSFNKKDSTGYAATSYKDEDGRRIYLKMHRLILGTPKELEVDHRNGDGLDNQRENIWNCSHKENLRSRRYIDKTKDYRHWMTEVDNEDEEKARGTTLCVAG